MRQALSKRKRALHKSKLADAALRKASLKTRLYRSRAQHAKHVLDAANNYIEDVRWTIRQYKHKSALLRRGYRVTDMTRPGDQYVQCAQLFLWIEHH